VLLAPALVPLDHAAQRCRPAVAATRRASATGHLANESAVEITMGMGFPTEMGTFTPIWVFLRSFDFELKAPTGQTDRQTGGRTGKTRNAAY